MTKLAYLHEPGVLQNLHCRYNINEIYTYTGSILIAVNPFQKLPHLYDGDMMERYKGSLLGELNPHPFAVADAAYRTMINEGVSQSILVSGESGAGKTESTKSLMRYFAYMGGRTQTGGRTVEQQVLESNPVLEAFGNAKTVRNNNSSRFGKFVEIQFDESGRISGAAVRTYLLERTRICQVSDPERNYHCFYMLCAAPAEDIEKYKLGNPRMFHYLNQSNCYELDGIDDANGYLETRRAMDIVGINSSEQDAIFRIVAAILHLGNIEFLKGKDGDSSEPGDGDSRFHLQMTAELLMCDEIALEDSLCKRVILTRGETITKSLEPNAATISRDALAKIIYSRLFDWIVRKINSSIGQDPNSKFLIGVLDIYGFESFQSNSFEQFCINLTNEKLQQHFNQHVFKMEQEEYTREEINWTYIDFIDNRDVLDLIEKKPGGIIALLDEACMFPRSTHETFAQKLYQTFSTHTRFRKPKLSRSDFTICHYAGEVTYQTEFFLDKNKDYVVVEHQSLLGASQCPFVSDLFPSLHEDSSKASKFSSIGSRFKQQLVALLETLNATNPHYIRCIKPNSFLKPAIFENSNVLQQLKCGGVMEAIRISCAGYPTRRSFDEFVGRFGILDPAVVNGSFDEVTAARRILNKAKLANFQIGKNKVFLRAGQMAELDARRIEVLMRSAGAIQRKIRSYLGRKTFILLRRSAIKIQAACRGVVGRCLFESVKAEAACIIIQKCIRMHLTMKAHQMLCFAAFIVQTGVRGMAARRELSFRRQSQASVIIQTYSRRLLARDEYVRFRKAVIVFQCAWRVRVSRRELWKLRMDARETGALKEAKNKLEKQVEDLTLLLEMEKRIRVDVEEARTQETSRLQSKLDGALHDVAETKTFLIKEREAVKAAIKETNVVREALYLEHEREMLKVSRSVAEVARETDSLKEVNSKLEDKVGELNLLLQSEKSMRVDGEEARKQDTLKLQSELGEAQHEIEEMRNLLLKEREAVKAATDQTTAAQVALAATHKIQIKAAMETEALRDIKSKLEEKVEELTLLIHTEKDIRIDEEETMKHECSKLQLALEKAQHEIEETRTLLMKERESEKTVVDKAIVFNEDFDVDDPGFDYGRKIIKAGFEEKEAEEMSKLWAALEEMELQLFEAKRLQAKECDAVNLTNSDSKQIYFLEGRFVDNEAMCKLSFENEELKTLVSSLERKIDQTEKKYEESAKLNDVHMKQALDAENKIIQLKMDMQRLEEKLSDFEVVDEPSTPQHISMGSPAEAECGRVGLPTQPLENGHLDLQSVTPREAESKLRRLNTQRNHEAVDALLKCVSQEMGFEHGKPVAAFTIYRCLLQWKSFEAEKTSVFDCIVQLIGSAIEDQDNNGHLAYWLSNTSALLFLLQGSLKSMVTSGSIRKPPNPTSLFGRMAQGFRSSSSSSNLSTYVLQHVVPRYPALLFKQQLSAYVEKMCGIIRDNLKRDLASTLTSCILTSKTPRANVLQSRSDPFSPDASVGYWKRVTESLSSLRNTLNEYFVPPVFVQKILNHSFSYINAQLFNSLLIRQECCTFSNGEYVKAGLDELELWCNHDKDEYGASCWDELEHLRQAVGFLVIHQKSRISYDDIANDLCSVLSVHQIYRICTLYWDDIYNTSSISPDVVSNMKTLVKVGEDDDEGDNNSFLLDDNSSYPFSVDEVPNSEKGMDFSHVTPPHQLLHNPAFRFLKDQA